MSRINLDQVGTGVSTNSKSSGGLRLSEEVIAFGDVYPNPIDLSAGKINCSVGHKWSVEKFFSDVVDSIPTCSPSCMGSPGSFCRACLSRCIKGCHQGWDDWP